MVKTPVFTIIWIVYINALSKWAGPDRKVLNCVAGLGKMFLGEKTLIVWAGLATWSRRRLLQSSLITITFTDGTLL